MTFLNICDKALILTVLHKPLTLLFISSPDNKRMTFGVILL